MDLQTVRALKEELMGIFEKDAMPRQAKGALIGATGGAILGGLSGKTKKKGKVTSKTLKQRAESALSGAVFGGALGTIAGYKPSVKLPVRGSTLGSITIKPRPTSGPTPLEKLKQKYEASKPSTLREYAEEKTSRHYTTRGKPKVKAASVPLDYVETRLAALQKMAGFLQTAGKVVSEHPMELAGLGMLAKPSIDSLRGKHPTEGNKAKWELAGLGTLAAHPAYKLLRGGH